MNDKISEKAVWDELVPSEDEKTSSASFGQSAQAQMMFCYKCNQVIPANSAFCPWCQTELFVTCPKCGNKYSSQYPACNQCGTNREAYMQELKRLEAKRLEEERIRNERIKEQQRIDEEKRRERERLERIEQEKEFQRLRKEREENQIKLSDFGETPLQVFGTVLLGLIVVGAAIAAVLEVLDLFGLINY